MLLETTMHVGNLGTQVVQKNHVMQYSKGPIVNFIEGIKELLLRYASSH